MFSYRHIYHAGNFADVMKHALLTLLVRAMQRKDTPFCYLDTHGGIGRYDLRSEQAQKTGEFHQGIEPVLAAASPPAGLSDYLAAVRACNHGDFLDYYPGSPRVTRFLLRPQDRMVLSELNPVDILTLKQEFAGDRQVAVHLKDAYAGLKAFLPPPEKRALILIDPAFERKDEYARLIQGLLEAHARFPTGVYAIWYPIMSRALVNRFYADIQASGLAKILRCELIIRASDDRSIMSGSGMLIINPPWQLEEQVRPVLDWLWAILKREECPAPVVDWLVTEAHTTRSPT